ncbi:helix-turn-helix transcriptional regulator [Zoogloea sp.]|uniref:helix-turn-helix domain-containing protein n=1 Tax=Zoogloea sp. TaxID=49181 RepID=UPI0014165994|nr:MAG: helix-turn-helix transcriptional regulator [Zoogloea sp.]
MAIDKMAVANRLKQFAISKNLKVKELAEALGMQSSSFQSTYWNGRSLPGAEILLRLEDMGCDTVWLLSGRTTEEAMLRNRISELETQVRALNEHLDRTTAKLSSVLVEHREVAIHPIKPPQKKVPH